MSLMTKAALIDKYGLRLSMDQLAEVLGIHRGSIYNLLSTGEMQIRTYTEGRRRFASYEAVAEYLDSRDEAAKAKAVASET